MNTNPNVINTRKHICHTQQKGILYSNENTLTTALFISIFKCQNQCELGKKAKEELWKAGRDKTKQYIVLQICHNKYIQDSGFPWAGVYWERMWWERTQESPKSWWCPILHVRGRFMTVHLIIPSLLGTCTLYALCSIHAITKIKSWQI